MTLQSHDLYPNAKVNYGGDVTVLDINSTVVTIATEDGEVKQYLVENFLESGEPYQPPPQENNPQSPVTSGTSGTVAETTQVVPQQGTPTQASTEQTSSADVPGITPAAGSEGSSAQVTPGPDVPQTETPTGIPPAANSDPSVRPTNQQTD